MILSEIKLNKELSFYFFIYFRFKLELTWEVLQYIIYLTLHKKIYNHFPYWLIVFKMYFIIRKGGWS